MVDWQNTSPEIPVTDVCTVNSPKQIDRRKPEIGERARIGKMTKNGKYIKHIVNLDSTSVIREVESR